MAKFISGQKVRVKAQHHIQGYLNVLESNGSPTLSRVIIDLVGKPLTVDKVTGKWHGVFPARGTPRYQLEDMCQLLPEYVLEQVSNLRRK